MAAKPKSSDDVMGRYPWHEKPIHEFLIEGHTLAHREHHRYLAPYEIDGRHGSYRIYTPGRIIYKWPDQMDRYLNGHVWSLDGDERKAAACIRERVDADAMACKKEMERIRTLESQLASIERALGTGTAPGEEEKNA